jgi:hypothetical protein
VLYLHENHVGVSGARDMKAALLHNKSLKVYSGPGSDNTKEFRKWDEVPSLYLYLSRFIH